MPIGLLIIVSLLTVSMLTSPAIASPRAAGDEDVSVPYAQLVTSGVCLLGAAGAKDGNATAGWATLGIGLGFWAAWDWWIGPSLRRAKRFPPAREIKPAARFDGIDAAPSWPRALR